MPCSIFPNQSFLTKSLNMLYAFLRYYLCNILLELTFCIFPGRFIMHLPKLMTRKYELRYYFLHCAKVELCVKRILKFCDDHYCIHKSVMHFFLDINECIRNTDNCHANALCTNTDGSFQCTCLTGYAGNGVICAGMEP